MQLGPGPGQAQPGQLLDGGDGVQFGDDAERVSSGKCGSDCCGVYVEIREFVGNVFIHWMASVVMTLVTENLICSAMRSTRMSWA